MLFAADRLIGLYDSGYVWVEWLADRPGAGLFKKYDIDFNLVFISSSPVAIAA